MKSYLFLTLAFLVQAAMVFADWDGKTHPYKSTFYGCPDECSTEKNPKCDHGLPSNDFFVALHPNYFKSKPYKYCDNYYVGMIIDDKAHGEYKMIRAKVVDQCGSCAPTQVDLSQTAFEHLAKKSTGVVNMIFVIVNAKTGEIMDGPHYNSSAMESFAKAQGVSKSTVVNSFKQAARAMNSGDKKGLSSFPWKDGKFADSGDDDHEDREEHEEHEEKKTTTRKTTTRKTTTTHKHTTTTTTRKTTTTTTRKTTTTKTTTTKIAFPTVAKLTTIVLPNAAKTTPLAATTTAAQIVTPHVPADPQPLIEKPAHKPSKPVEKEEEKKEEKETEKETDELDDFDKENGGTDAPVTAGVIGGTAAVVGAAGVGLLMLKRQSPQKYDDLKQKFPEAFGTVKRSLTRGASTIKRGVSRSVSRRGNNTQNVPVPASYTFTLSSEDGLPRVALYDDPYPTKAHGSQHW
jgi:hypothetical protein